MAREPCCTISYSGSVHFPKGGTWYIWWLPKGYAPTDEDVMICALPEQNGWEAYGLSRGERPPLVQAVVDVIEAFYNERRQ